VRPWPGILVPAIPDRLARVSTPQNWGRSAKLWRSMDQRNWPEIRSVTVATQSSAHAFMKGDGRLSVGPGLLRCDLNPRTARVAQFDAVTHVGSIVHLYHQRLFPLMNLSVCVDDGVRRVFARTWGLSLGQLCRDLRDSGFQPEVHNTWINAGFSYHRS